MEETTETVEPLAETEDVIYIKDTLLMQDNFPTVNYNKTNFKKKYLN